MLARARGYFYDGKDHNDPRRYQAQSDKPDTLRAWERRYGLPQPERTSGGHRLYSQRDVDTVKWLLARQREGMRIRGAVALWRGLQAEGRDPLRALSEAR